MSSANLTRDEARERAALLDVFSYDVTLDLTAGDKSFLSTTVIRFASRQHGASTFVDLLAPGVREITLNGHALDPDTVYSEGRIDLDGLEAENELRVVAECAYTNTGEGLHRMVDPADGKTYLYTQFEVPNARRVFANFDQPDLKASFTFTVTVPSHWTVLSNANVLARESVDSGTSTWHFAPTPRISTYITALVAGEYHVVSDVYVAKRGQVVPMTIGCRASLAAFLDADEIFAVTKQGFDYFLDVFGRDYPFTKYDQMFVPEYNGGAMENAGCVTFTEEYVFRSKQTDASYRRRADTMLHELAHMWFGDLVTMTWWDDVWLKESFATFASARCQAEGTRWTDAWTTFADTKKSAAYRQDQLPSTHPIVADIRDLADVRVNFDAITYSKGASVLKQLVAWVGADEFFAGARLYFDQHAWSNTSLQDLLDALEETSGRELSSWSKAWLETAGPNTLRPQFTTNADGTFASFAILQEADARYPTLRPHRIAIGLYDLVDGALVRTTRVELDVVDAITEVSLLVGRARPDLVLLNDDDLTYAKIRFDEHSWATLQEHIADFADSLPRTLCWVAAWDMVRNAELPARDYVTLVLSGISRETESGSVQTLLQQATSAVEDFADPSWRPIGQQMLAGVSHTHLMSAAPGSDLQLLWGRSLAWTARSEEQFALVAGLLDGSAAVDGLTVDADLRWALLLALVTAGRAGESEIDAELARDQTAAGRNHAARARAARPLAEAKQAAWTAAVGRHDLPNATQAALIGGFGLVSAQNRDLLRPYLDHYFAALDDIWESHSPEIAQSIVTGLYPALLGGQDVVDRTDAFLADAEPAPVLRRLLLESRDGVVRGLKAQALDGATGSPTLEGPGMPTETSQLSSLTS